MSDQQKSILYNLYASSFLVDRGTPGWHKEAAIISALEYLVRNTPELISDGGYITPDRTQADSGVDSEPSSL